MITFASREELSDRVFFTVRKEHADGSLVTISAISAFLGGIENRTISLGIRCFSKALILVTDEVPGLSVSSDCYRTQTLAFSAGTLDDRLSRRSTKHLSENPRSTPRNALDFSSGPGAPRANPTRIGEGST